MIRVDAVAEGGGPKWNLRAGVKLFSIQGPWRDHGVVTAAIPADLEAPGTAL